MGIRRQLLEHLAHEILGALSTSSEPTIASLTSAMVDYHGFAKQPMPEEFLKQFPSAEGVDLRDLQVDLVRVSTDLTSEVHFHAKASAYVVCLGSGQRLTSPCKAKVFLEDRWREFAEGETIEIPAGTLHGFTVDPGGIFYFLSVQSPPIGRHGEEDDYHRAIPEMIGAFRGSAKPTSRS